MWNNEVVKFDSTYFHLHVLFIITAVIPDLYLDWIHSTAWCYKNKNDIPLRQNFIYIIKQHAQGEIVIHECKIKNQQLPFYFWLRCTISYLGQIKNSYFYSNKRSDNVRPNFQTRKFHPVSNASVHSAAQISTTPPKHRTKQVNNCGAATASWLIASRTVDLVENKRGCLEVNSKEQSTF